MLIIGDIAGQYKTLLALIDKCPDDDIVAVGDLIDRGPDSKQVLDYFMDHPGNCRAIFGNHEAMMIDAFASMRFGDFQDWIGNGGGYTLRSFDVQQMPLTDEVHLTLEKYLEWIDHLPLFVREPGLIVTHAPIPEGLEPNSQMQGGDLDLWVWNRNLPVKREGELQVFGHNSNWGLRYMHDGYGTENTPWGVCIDTSQQRILTGLQWPSMKVFQQPYLD